MAHSIPSTATPTDLSIGQLNRQMQVARALAQQNYVFAMHLWLAKDHFVDFASESPRVLRLPAYQLFLRAALRDMGLLSQSAPKQKPEQRGPG